MISDFPDIAAADYEREHESRLLQLASHYAGFRLFRNQGESTRYRPPKREVVSDRGERWDTVRAAGRDLRIDEGAIRKAIRQDRAVVGRRFFYTDGKGAATRQHFCPVVRDDGARFPSLSAVVNGDEKKRDYLVHCIRLGRPFKGHLYRRETNGSVNHQS